MQTQELQKKCCELVGELDRKYAIERDSHLSFTQLMEEIGELAKDINYPRLRGKETDIENLQGEFGDVFMQLCALAELYQIDIEKAALAKINIVAERNGLSRKI